MTPITKYRNFKLTTLLMDLGYTALFNTAIATILFILDTDERGFWIYFQISQCIGLTICSSISLFLYFFKPKTRSSQVAIWLMGLGFGSTVGSLLAATFLGEEFSLLERLDIPLSMAMIGVVFGLIASYFFISRESYVSLKMAAHDEKLRRINAEKETIQANLKTLQAQIEPHFLFNTLSNVLSLLETDLEKGKTMLDNLTQYLRTSLILTRKETNTLGEEISMIRTYLDIQGTRMGSRLAYAISVPKELESLRLPPMLIQPLVENAIKHGLEPKLEGGRVDIRAEKNAAAQTLRIVVVDTGVGIGADASPGMGSLNINQRLEALFGERGRMTIAENQPAGIHATIEVPYDEP